MAVNIRPIEQSLAKFERNAINASSDYLKGTENPRRPWAESALAAEANYKTAITAAANEGRFGKGVKKSGNQRWASQIQRKGKANYETGVSGAGQDWAKGAAPYLTAVGSLNLAPRGAKNSTANYQRAQMVGDTQHKLKQSLLSGSR